ncbi:hypothetical protein E2562_005203 [Oryza meyeriana var. granulata]|uniref:HIT-type domain-containing protein n=1 Tax=Oryza meyeriana var. granulata TaxID=110450 RepID=A0A6G1BSZ3_9ORYZ|nr:hypothetical protein E2562_005203 [Oryza meyeriana var. granulata]
MSSSRSCSFAVSVLLVLAVTASAGVEPTHEEPHHERILLADADADAHLLHKEEEAAATIAAAGVRVASAADQKKDDAAAAIPAMEWQDAKASGLIATQGDDESSSSPSAGGGGNGHGKEQGSGGGKEGEKSKSCVTKEECHKKRLICGKSCTMSAHTKCAAKCSKSCIPNCN